MSYRFSWHTGPGTTRPGIPGADRIGTECILLARGTMNSALIEFLDGTRVVTSRNALRRWDR